jgi:hypothetical protein
MYRKSVAEKYRKKAIMTQNFLLWYTNTVLGSRICSYNNKMQYGMIRIQAKETARESNFLLTRLLTVTARNNMAPIIGTYLSFFCLRAE